MNDSPYPQEAFVKMFNTESSLGSQQLAPGVQTEGIPTSAGNEHPEFKKVTQDLGEMGLTDIESVDEGLRFPTYN